MKQQSSDGDLESFFSMDRASSVPRPTTNYSVSITDAIVELFYRLLLMIMLLSCQDQAFDEQFPSKKGPEVSRTTDSLRKAASSANIVDDLSSIFRGTTMDTWSVLLPC